MYQTFIKTLLPQQNFYLPLLKPFSQTLIKIDILLRWGKLIGVSFRIFVSLQKNQVFSVDHAQYFFNHGMRPNYIEASVLDRIPFSPRAERGQIIFNHWNETESRF
jgi:hypothetical protein